jgi:hypothetical protein
VKSLGRERARPWPQGRERRAGPWRRGRWVDVRRVVAAQLLGRASWTVAVRPREARWAVAAQLLDLRALYRGGTHVGSLAERAGPWRQVRLVVVSYARRRGVRRDRWVDASWVVAAPLLGRANWTVAARSREARWTLAAKLLDLRALHRGGTHVKSLGRE